MPIERKYKATIRLPKFDWDLLEEVERRAREMLTDPEVSVEAVDEDGTVSATTLADVRAHLTERGTDLRSLHAAFFEVVDELTVDSGQSARREIVFSVYVSGRSSPTAAVEGPREELVRGRAATLQQHVDRLLESVRG